MRQALKFQQVEAAKYLPLIEKVAKRVARRLPSHVEVCDLISAGVLGLADAMAKYDPSKQADFAKYAEWRIKGAILDELRAADPMSRDQRRETNEIKTVENKLATALGRTPEEQEVAAALSIDLDALHARKGRADAALPVQVESFDIAPSNDEGPEARVAAAQERAQLASAIATLPERLRQVVELYYQGDLSLKEIGARLGVTESRVCQLHGEAVKQLRARMAA